jgi:hypothetical protein
MVGGAVSTTVTVKVQLAELPAISVAVDVTMVVPFGKVEPEGGMLVMDTTPQLSVATGTYLTTAEHAPVSLATVWFDGHTIVGGLESARMVTDSR